MTESAATTMENVALTLDNGAVLDFRGRLFSEASWFDEDSGVLTHQKLYVTEGNEQVYSVASGAGRTRSRRAYRVSLHGEACTINDGRTEMTLDLEMLMLAVRALSGLEKDDAPTLDTVEETLRAANC